MDNFKLCFISNSKSDKEDVIMNRAFELSKQNLSNVVWQKESEVNIKTLKKTDCIVFSDFNGKFYDSLKDSQCVRIIGPQALIDCLSKSKEIPNYPWPILNIAMHSVVICCSKIPKADKSKVREKVQLMGGLYSERLLEKTTHLVTDSTKSEKYLVAAERGLKVMLPSWIDAVWDENQSGNINADNGKFDAFSCLPFQNLNICSTGITNVALKKALSDLIQNNGGSLVGKMNLSETDVLICYGESGMTSQKYRAASRCADIMCLSIDWIYDSVKKGYALRSDDYEVRKKATSTPTSDGLPNFSTMSGMSVIGEPNSSQMSNIEETVNWTAASGTNIGTPKKGSTQRSQSSKMLASDNFGHSEDTLAALMKNMDNVDLTENQGVANKNPNSQSQSSTLITEQETSQGSIFSGYTFMLGGFDEDENEALIENIESESGVVLSENSKEEPDYVVLPPFIPSEIPNTSHEIVNSLWIIECIKNDALIDISYYHRPLLLEDGVNPLENCVVTISSYTGYERQFLRMLIVKLGGVCQEQFARGFSTQKGILPSTHLVSLEMTGKKYEAALNWHLPVVTKDWLLECAKAKILLPEKDFILGDKCPSKTSDEDCESTSTNSKNKSDTSKDNGPVKIETPKKLPLIKDVEKTPQNQKPQFESETPDVGSQVTPVNKILEEARMNNLLDAPESPRRYYPWDPKTPETPVGGIGSKWSPKTRKNVEILINMLPDFVPPPRRRPSTPLHEIMERLKSRFFRKSNNHDMPGSDNQHLPDGEDEVFLKTPGQSETEPLEDMVTTKIQQLENMVTNSGGNRRKSRNFQSTLPASVAVPPSQPFTVSWDFTENKENQPFDEEKVFMISGIDNEQKQKIMLQLNELGAEVLDCSNYDPSATHLLCMKPPRNEKLLSCMASGKWILHASYVEECYKQRKFINEEEFEFGNPKCRPVLQNVDRDVQQRIKSVHWWRTEISKTHQGAFQGMKAIVVANNKEPIVRVIQAGGGTVLNVQPPFEGKIDATHCLIEAKSVKDMSLYIPLAEQGIYCLNTLYVNDFLHRITKDIVDSVLPPFVKYYTKS